MARSQCFNQRGIYIPFQSLLRLHRLPEPLQSIPSSSASRSVLAAALAKLGRIEEAKAIALQVLALDPSFSAARFCAATGLPTPLAEPMTDAWTTAGLPP
jgi:hypothetical protein